MDKLKNNERIITTTAIGSIGCYSNLLKIKSFTRAEIINQLKIELSKWKQLIKQP